MNTEVVTSRAISLDLRVWANSIWRDPRGMPTTEAICFQNIQIHDLSTYRGLTENERLRGPTATCPLNRELNGIAHRCPDRTRQPGVGYEALRGPPQLPHAPALGGLRPLQAAAACRNEGEMRRVPPLPVTVRCLRRAHHDQITWRVYDSINMFQGQMNSAHVYR